MKATLKRFILTNFNWALFVLKVLVTAAVYLCLNTLKGWLGFFFVLSLIVDIWLLKHSPGFDFELTEEESKRRNGISTEDFNTFLKTSPKVRLLRIGVIAMLAMVIKLFSTDPFVVIFFVSYVMGALFVDFLIRKILRIPIPVSIKGNPVPLRFHQGSDDLMEKHLKRIHEENTAFPGSAAWSLRAGREIK